MWIVIVTKSSSKLEGIFGKDYFPRKLRYKADAERLLEGVYANGGVGCVQPIGGKYKQILMGYTVGVKTSVEALDKSRTQSEVIRRLIPLQLFETTNGAMGLFEQEDGRRRLLIIS